MTDRDTSDPTIESAVGRLQNPGFGPEDLLGVLSHRHRRLALAVLDEREGPVEFDALAAEIAARDADGPAAVPEAERRERVRVGLHHWHLPKLADAGLVEYDRGTGTVRGASALAGDGESPVTGLLDRLGNVS